MDAKHCAAGAAPAFDRNSGKCIDNTNGFIRNCPSTPPPPTTTTTTTQAPPNVCAGVPDFEYVKLLDCTAWAFCYGGVNYDTGKCECGSVSGDPEFECVPDTTNCNPCGTPGPDTTLPGAPTPAPTEGKLLMLSLNF